jgi:hypothetical protein
LEHDTPPARAAFAGSPLAWPIRDAVGCLAGRAASATLPSVAALDEALGGRAGVRFVPAPPRRRRGPRPMQYDACIVLRGEVPTRANSLHDLMNALVWATFPRSKRAIHERQVRLGAPARPRARSPEGDAVAMLDEGGIVIVAADDRRAEVEAAARARDAEAVAACVAAGAARGVVFGHAIYEHLARGAEGPAATPVLGMPVVLPAAGDPGGISLAQVDELLAAWLRNPASLRAPSDYGSLPAVSRVLGGDA